MIARSFISALILSLFLILSVEAADQTAQPQPKSPIAYWHSGPDIGASDPSKMPATIEKTLLHRRPSWIDAWEFLGLTKNELKAKISSYNQAIGPEYVPKTLSDDAKSLNLGDRYVGDGYEFEYAGDRVVRTRKFIYTCTSPTSFTAWYTDRLEALKYCLSEYNLFIDCKHREIEKELCNIKSSHASCTHAWRMSDYLSELRDLYLKRAELSRELGQKTPNAEYLACDVHIQFEQWKAKLSSQEKKDWAKYRYD